MLQENPNLSFKKMNPQVKKLWLEALRCGEYSQGKGVLHRDLGGILDEFCCLGVLCKLAHVAKIVTKVRDRKTGSYLYGGHYTILPMEVLIWSGVRTAGGRLPKLVTSLGSRQFNKHSLLGLNDQGATFLEIADVIEEQL